MPLSYEECLRQGLLRRMPPSKDKAAQSLQKAQRWLAEARQTLKSGASGAAVLAAYLAMFHAARALLFRDGFREKRHVCVARYLDQYVKKAKGLLEQQWVDLLDHSRETRHDDQYDLSFISSAEDAHQAVQSAGAFLKRLQELVHALHKASGS